MLFVTIFLRLMLFLDLYLKRNWETVQQLTEWKKGRDKNVLATILWCSGDMIFSRHEINRGRIGSLRFVFVFRSCTLCYDNFSLNIIETKDTLLKFHTFNLLVPTAFALLRVECGYKFHSKYFLFWCVTLLTFLETLLECLFY